MRNNLTDAYHILASGAADHLGALLHNPLCLIDLTAALLYLAAFMALWLFGHRWLLPVYLALAATSIAAAVAHGGMLP
jgi:hypothetical protein